MTAQWMESLLVEIILAAIDSHTRMGESGPLRKSRVETLTEAGLPAGVCGVRITLGDGHKFVLSILDQGGGIDDAQ